MDLLLPTVNQMIFLFLFILLGFVLTKTGYLPKTASTILSKLENMLFLPALVLGTFIKNFTVEKVSSYWKILLFSTILELVLVPVCILICKLCAKDRYTQKIYTYGLCFSNFGFMGNAVVAAIFPEYFTEYIIFTLPLWSLIYIWGVPTLLIGNDEKKHTIGDRLKPFINPMFICMLIGMVIGITGVGSYIPDSILSVVEVSGDCMSPIAMLLTGITLAASDLKQVLRRGSIYTVSALRLLVFPLIAIGLFALLPVSVSDVLVICTVCSLAMPLGLNTIVVPSAYGKDASTAAGMALVSHLASILTIPVIFILLRMILA